MKPVWITYAHRDNESRILEKIVSQLKTAGVDALYDRTSLIPGQSLWGQIAQHLDGNELSGFIYLLSKHSVTSPRCIEEMNYALGRALSSDPTFPIIGLIDGLTSKELPPAIRSRLYVNLNDQNWIEMLRAGLERRPPTVFTNDLYEFGTSITFNYQNRQGVTAFEIHPRFGETHNWRWAFPKLTDQPIAWGTGPIGGHGIATTAKDALSGEISFPDGDYHFVGSDDKLTSGTSAYLIFEKSFPRQMYFGYASGPTDIPESWIPLGFNTESPDFSKYIKA